MALPFTVASLDAVPEPQRSLYVQRDGKYVLDIDGVEELGDKGKAALERERKERREIEAQLKRVREQLGDADPVKAREALKALAQLEDRASLTDVPEPLQARVEELAKRRTDRMREEFDAQVKERDARISAAEARLSQLLITDRLRAAAVAGNVRKSAIDDAVLLGERFFRLNKDGQPVAYKGDEPLYGKSGQPLTPEEWIAERTKDREHWFEPSAGGGAQGSSSAHAASGAVVLSAADARDTTRYRAAREQAAKQGVELRIQ